MHVLAAWRAVMKSLFSFARRHRSPYLIPTSALVVFTVAVVGLIAWLMFVYGPAHQAPCVGWNYITGPQVYHGKLIQCFHGDVVRVGR